MIQRLKISKSQSLPSTKLTIYGEKEGTEIIEE